MKHLHITFLLTVLMSMVGVNTFAVDTYYIDGIYYNFSGTKATVTSGGSNSYSGHVVIPKSVTYNGKTYSVTSIGEKAFYKCVGLTSVNIPYSVTRIGEEAFYQCNGLASVHITDIASWCSIWFGDLYANPLSYARHLYINGEEIKDLIIPNSVTSISFGAFYGCSGLTSVTIPNSVTSIRDGAFQNCSGLTSVTIGNSVTSIGTDAFKGCSGLTSVHITDIASWCSISFSGGANPLSYAHHLYLNGVEIKDLVIPNSVTAIGWNAFYGCSGLTSVTIGNSVTSIGNSAFQNCSGLTSVTIGNSVTSIGDYAFYGCSGLTSVTIPNSVKSIGNSSFYKCSALTSLTIGSGITRIPHYLLYNCTNLKDLYCYIEEVPTTDSNAFANANQENATLHVPDAALNDYKMIAPWSQFGKIVGLSGGGGGGTTPQKCATPTISYNAGRLTYSSATDDVTFHSTITDTDITAYSTSEIDLTVTYNINVYATKAGYETSDVATATLCWIDKEPQTEGITNGVAQLSATPVLIQSNGGILTVEGADDGTLVSIYNTAGQMGGSAVSSNGHATVFTNLESGTIAIVKIGNKSVKVVMK